MPFSAVKRVYKYFTVQNTEREHFRELVREFKTRLE